MVQLSHPYITNGKTIALIIWTFVSKVMSLLFNMLSSKEQVSFNFMGAVTVHSDFKAQENEIWHCFHIFPIYLPWSDRTGCHDLRFLNIEYYCRFCTLLFHLHQEAFSSSSLSAIRVVSSAYLRLLIFLLAILIPACASSSPAFPMMYCAYNLNRQGDNMQPWCTPPQFGTSPLFYVWF